MPAICQFLRYLDIRAASLLLAMGLAVVLLPLPAWTQSGVSGVITAEPVFTAGTSNTIEFEPTAIGGADVYEVCYFDEADSVVHACIELAPGQSLGAAAANVTIESLEDGHTYGYYIQAHFIAADSVAYSDTTSSTQDASPPQTVADAAAGDEPGGIVVLGWTGVDDAVSSLRQYYVYRRLTGQAFSLIDSVTPGAVGAPHTYLDSLASSSGLIEAELHWYQVRAVDLVENGVNSNLAGPVAPDSTTPVIPTLTLENEYIDLNDTAYQAGVRTQVTGRSNGTGAAATDSIRFEWARDSTEYFTTQWQPGWHYGASGWLPYEPDSLYWNQSLLPHPDSIDFVHNHIYWFRAQAKDTAGNISAWSDSLDTVGAYMDAKPPSDIANLTVEIEPDPLGEACVILLGWDAATDFPSGVAQYDIYRGPDTNNLALIASVDAGLTTYNDSCENLLDRNTLWYKVGSRDNVGNVRGPSESNWVGSALPPLPPILTTSCDTVVAGRCFVVQYVIASWTDYDNASVTKYTIDVNGVQHDILDPIRKVDTIVFLSDGVYEIRVRSTFSDGNVSIWSYSEFVTADNSAPSPVDGFKVAADTSYTGNIYLSWSKPDDTSDVVKYFIYRKKAEEASYTHIATNFTNDNENYPNDGTIYTDLYADAEDDSLIAYQWYLYQSQPVDMLGNDRNNPEPVDSAYCTRPPTIDDHDGGQDSVYIHWLRASPNLATQWYDSVRIFRDSYDSLVTIRAVYSDSGDYTYFPASLEPANYILQVKEMPLNPQLVGRSSSWSEPRVVPFDNRPPAPESLWVQPQPFLFGGSSRIYVAWFYEDPALVDSFTVIRRVSGVPDVLLSVPAGGDHYDSFMDLTPWGESLHEYGVYAHDSLGQISDTIWASGIIDPRWMFTPNLAPLVPVYFNSDTLTLTWQWLDANLDVVGNIYGAESCQVQISIDSGFNDILPHVDGAWTGADGLTVDVVGMRALADFLGSSEKRLYCRVKGMDRWGHMSPWSTDYWSPTLALLDDRPPSRCSTLVIDSTRADGSSSDRAVDVYLDWSQSADRGGAGMKSYKVYRMNPDASTTLLQTLDYAVTEYLDDSVDVGDVANCDYSYWVQPVDSVGNEQTFANNVVCLNVLSAPRIDSVTATKVCWTNQDPVAADYYYAVVVLDSLWFGTFIEDTLGGTALIDGDSSCWQFQTNFDAAATLFYHIKAIRGEFESNWSEVVTFVPLPTDAEDGGESAEQLPRTFALYPNYPNPFNPETRIGFDLPRRCDVILDIYNIKGERVQTISRGSMGAGRHAITWDGTNRQGLPVASGVYFYQLRAAEWTETRKMVLLR